MSSSFSFLDTFAKMVEILKFDTNDTVMSPYIILQAEHWESLYTNSWLRFQLAINLSRQGLGKKALAYQRL